MRCQIPPYEYANTQQAGLPRTVRIRRDSIADFSEAFSEETDTVASFFFSSFLLPVLLFLSVLLEDILVARIISEDSSKRPNLADKKETVRP